MTGNISKKIGRGQQGPQGPQGIRGPMPHIKFRYDAVTGNLYCETDGIFTADDYVGMRVESTEKLDELVEQGVVNVGVIYTVNDRVATNGYLVTGKVSDLFEYGSMSAFGGSEEELYIFQPKFSVPDECVKIETIYLHNADRDYVGYLDYPWPGMGQPSYIELSKLGASNVDDTISFYVEKPSPDGSFKHKIVDDNERSFYHNGESWVEVMTAKHLGDIDKALDAILDLDSKLLGGDA